MSPSDAVVIYNGFKVAEEYSSRCSVTSISPRGSSTLTIHNIVMSDAGTYSCKDIAGEKTFSLVVLGKEVDTSLNRIRQQTATLIYLLILVILPMTRKTINNSNKRPTNSHSDNKKLH